MDIFANGYTPNRRIMAIAFPGDVGGGWDTRSNCSEITVEMVNGQCAFVPWFIVHRAGKPPLAVNTAHIETVEYW